MTGYYDDIVDAGRPARMDGWRHRAEQWLRFETIRRGLDIGAETSIVDLGCGTGRFRMYLGDDYTGDYLGIDRRTGPLERARSDMPGDRWMRADWADERIDREGPFDVAIAVGTLVGGEENTGRHEVLKELAERLDELGRRGWALVVLDQKRLEADPIRRLDPALRGATRGELRGLATRAGSRIAVADQIMPSDLFALVDRGVSPDVILGRLDDGAPHRGVLNRARTLGRDFDAAERTRLWLVAGRPDPARRALDDVSDDHSEYDLLRARVTRLADGGD